MNRPVLGLYFKVSFTRPGILDTEINFQEVTGLGTSVDFEALEEGGNTFFTYNLPKKTKNDKIVLKRAISETLEAKELLDWAEKSIYNFDFKPLEVKVILLNANKDPIKGWSFSYVIPTKIEYSGLNAITQALVIETLELSYLYATPINN